jgi:hypothetical protein
MTSQIVVFWLWHHNTADEQKRFEATYYYRGQIVRYRCSWAVSQHYWREEEMEPYLWQWEQCTENCEKRALSKSHFREESHQGPEWNRGKYSFWGTLLTWKWEHRLEGSSKRLVFLISSSWFHMRAVFSQFPVHFPTVPVPRLWMNTIHVSAI